MILKEENNAPTIEFSESFLGIINPFYSRINVGYLRDWQSFLKKKQYKRERNTDESYARICVDACKSYLTTSNFAVLEGSEKQWAEAVIYISLYWIVGANAKIVWPLELSPDNDGGLVESILITRVTDLYESWKEEPKEDSKGDFNTGYPCARAYAYCILIEALIGKNILKGSEFNKSLLLNGYLETADDKSIELIFDYLNWGFSGRGSFGKNYLTRFVSYYAINQSPAGETSDHTYIEHFKLLDLNMLDVQNLKRHDKPISIMLVGLTSNGKSYIITALNSAFLEGNYVGCPLGGLTLTRDVSIQETELPNKKELHSVVQGQNYISSNEMGGTTFHTLLQGKLEIGGNDYELEMFDSVGAAILENPTPIHEKEKRTLFEKAMANADLLLVVIDPRTLTLNDPTAFKVQVTNSITNKLDFLLETGRSHHTPIGILFSKFDEYGVIMTGPRRLINNNEQKHTLEKYIRSNGGINERVEFFNSLVKNDDFLPEMKNTLSFLLTKISGLLSIILGKYHHPAINIYLTKTERPEQQDFKRTGIPAILEDFCDYLDWLFNKASKPVAKFNSWYDVAKDEIILEWENGMRINSAYLIKRKTKFAQEFDVIGDGFMEAGTFKLKFLDKSIENGKVYTYLVELTNGTEMFRADVITNPNPIDKLAAKITSVTEGSDKLSIELIWNEIKCEYPINYLVQRKWTNEPNQPKKDWETLAPGLSINKFSDYAIERKGMYIYKVCVYKDDARSLNGLEATTEIIKIPKKGINWPFWMLIFILAVVFIYLIYYISHKSLTAIQ